MEDVLNTAYQPRSKAEAYGLWVIRYRKWIVPLVLLACVLLGSGMRKIGFDNDYRVYFGEDNPQLNDFESLQDIYTKNDNILIMLEPDDGDIFSRGFLSAVGALTEKAWEIPFSLRVDSITNYQHSRAEGDELIVEDLVPDPDQVTEQDREHIRAALSAEPLIMDRLVSKDFAVSAVNITLQLPELSPEEVPEAVKAVRAVLKDLHQVHPKIKSYLTGSVMMNNAFTEASKSDLSTLVPLMYLAIVLVMYVVLRAVAGVVVTVLVILFSTVVALGISGTLGIMLTPPSAQAPTIIMTLGVADCIHVLIGVFREMRHNGLSKHAAIVESLRLNLQPVFLTSLTTAIGFLSLNFGDVPPFRDLGNITAIGVGAAFLLSVLWMPAMLAVLPVRVRAVGPSAPSKSRLGVLAEFVIARRRWVLSGMTLLVVLLGFAIPLNELNDQFIDYFDERVKFRTDSDYIMEKLSGMYTIEHSLGADGPNGVADPEYLKVLEDFEEWYKEQPDTRHVASLAPVFRRLNMNLHEDDPAYYRIPDSRELGAQYLLLYELSLPYGLDLNNQINVDKSASRFTATLENVKSVRLREVEQSAQEWLRENAPDYMFSRGSSPGVMFAYIAERNIMSMIRGTIIAFLLVSLVLTFALRSLRLGLLSVLPNFAPIFITFGLWGLFIGEVGLAVSVTAAMTLGIVVDDTVHFLSKYVRARREKGLSAADAVRYAFSSVGTALVATSVILVAGFFVLTFSSFHLNTSMGRLVGTTIIAALVFDFLMLPALLLLFDRGKGSKEAVS